MKKKTKTTVNTIFYFAIFLGVFIAVLEYFLKFISINILIRAMVMYTGCSCVFFAVNLFSNTFRKLFKILLVIISFTLLMFYCRYFYVIDLAIVAIPENYKGDILLEFNNKASKKKSRPLDGIVILKVDSNGYFVTNSILNLSLINIGIAEIFNNRLQANKRLNLINTKISYNPNRITGTVVEN